MKCLCGYEGEDFIPLENQMVFQRGKDAKLPMYIASDDLKRVYACPKCGTLKIEASNEAK